MTSSILRCWLEDSPGLSVLLHLDDEECLSERDSGFYFERTLFPVSSSQNLEWWSCDSQEVFLSECLLREDMDLSITDLSRSYVREQVLMFVPGAVQVKLLSSEGYRCEGAAAAH